MPAAVSPDPRPSWGMILVRIWARRMVAPGAAHENVSDANPESNGADNAPRILVELLGMVKNGGMENLGKDEE